MENVNRVAFSIWTNNPCLWLSDEDSLFLHYSSESIHIVFPASFPPLPSVSSSLPLLIVNNNHHVWSICCWANIKWVISAKFIWQDITFSWEGELEAGSVLRLSQQMLSGSLACTHRPPFSVLTFPFSHICSVWSSSSLLLISCPLSSPLHSPLSHPRPTKPISCGTHTHTHCSVM